MLTKLLLAALLSGVSLAGSVSPSQQCEQRQSPAQIFRPRKTCGHMTGLEPSPEHTPWTHEVICRKGRDPDKKSRRVKKYCLYTRASPKTGRGVSIITTPTVAKTLLKTSSFLLYDQELDSKVSTTFEQRLTADRGLGLFATRDIKAGEVVFKDVPSLVIEDDAVNFLGENERPRLQWRGVLQLPKAEQQRLRSLDVSKGSDQITDILHTNSIGLILGQDDSHGALMPQFSRLNHACRPNIYYRFLEHQLSIEVFALKDIDAGEELVVSYMDTELPSKMRHEFLHDHWDFNCTCSLCAAPAEKLAASDRRLEHGFRVKKEIQRLLATDPQKVLDLCIEMLELYEEEGLITPRAIYNEMAAIAAVTLGDQQTAKVYAKESLHYWKIIASEDSDEYKKMKQVVKDPTRHASWNTWQNLQR